jgi:hypothetical protein
MINFGVTGDFDTAPDIEVLCNGIEQGMAEMLKLAEQSPPAPGPAPAPKAKKPAT